MTQDVLELSLTPAGHLVPCHGDTPAPGSRNWNIIEKFRSGLGSGLFFLGADPSPWPASLSVAFFREIARRYLERLCRTPESADRLEPIDPPEDLPGMLLGAPPMRGAEYLSEEVVRSLWDKLDGWVRRDIAASRLGVAEWLKERAPGWHQIGRVCFHLAENARDDDHPFAFLATYAPRISNAGRVQYQPLGRALEEYAGARNRDTLVQLLTPVHRASEKSALIKELVDSGDIFHPLAWTSREAYQLLKEVPVLEECGLLVRIPDWWRKRPRPRVAVTLGDAKSERFGADSILDFRVEVALGDEALSEAEWRKILASETGLIRLKGQWVEVDADRLSETLAHWKKAERAAGDDGIAFLEGMRLLAGVSADLAGSAGPSAAQDWSSVVAGRGLSKVLAALRDPAGIGGDRLPSGFRGELRPYQDTGRRWMRFLIRLGLGACLADDMGLGKTVQVLAVLLELKEESRPGRKPSILVLPASLLSNWKAEISRFAPDLKTRFVHPSEADSGGDADLVVTTYGMLLRQGRLLENAWHLAILDEAQAIKNPTARQTQAVKNLKAEARIVLTGTPIENRLGDLWSIFDFLCPGLLGTLSRFKSFVKTLETRTEDRYAPLRQLVQPYILRRLKTDRSVISDLPEKTEVKAFCGLSRRQAALYARTVEELERLLVGGLSGMKRRGTVLGYLLRLKQICNHPSQFLGDGTFQPSQSGKFDRLRELGEEIASRQEKTLIFTQFREMTGPIAAFLSEVFGREGLVLHGETPVGHRKALVDKFQRDDGPPFFVLSLKAGGTGLNLTAASHVIHFDRWWNPAVENQATDRAFRIGQKRNVLVHKFVCRGTVEEKIDTLIEEKSRMAGDILEGGAEVLVTEMGDTELLKLVALDINKAELDGGEQ